MAKLSFLDGFDFNINGKLGNTLFATETVDINENQCLCQVNIPTFTQRAMIAAWGKSTHFKIVNSCSCRDFENGVFETQMNESAIQPKSRS